MCVNFQLKQTTLTYLAQICPKTKLGFKIQTTKVKENDLEHSISQNVSVNAAFISSPVRDTIFCMLLF